MKATIRNSFIAATIESLPPDKKCFLLAEGNDYIVAVLMKGNNPVAYYIGDQAECLLAARYAKAMENFPWVPEYNLDEIEWILFACQTKKVQ